MNKLAKEKSINLRSKLAKLDRANLLFFKKFFKKDLELAKEIVNLSRLKTIASLFFLEVSFLK